MEVQLVELRAVCICMLVSGENWVAARCAMDLLLVVSVDLVDPAQREPCYCVGKTSL